MSHYSYLLSCKLRGATTVSKLGEVLFSVVPDAEQAVGADRHTASRRRRERSISLCARAARSSGGARPLNRTLCAQSAVASFLAPISRVGDARWASTLYGRTNTVRCLVRSTILECSSADLPRGTHHRSRARYVSGFLIRRAMLASISGSCRSWFKSFKPLAMASLTLSS